MRLQAMLLALLLLAPFAAAANDGGSGADAPDHWSAALPATSPTEGSLDTAGGDAGDWYRYASVPGKGIGILFSTHADFFRLEIRTLDGALLHGANYWNFFGGWGYISLEFLSPPSEVLVGILPHQGRSGDYRIAVEHFDVFDFAITSLTAEPLPVGAAGVPVAPGTQQLVRITIENRASVPGSPDVYLQAWHETTSNVRYVGYVWGEEIPAGGARTFEFVWDATGEIGDVRLDAEVSTFRDRNPADNYRSTRAHVLVANTGISADLLNGRHEHRIAGTEVEIESQYHTGWKYQQVCVEGVAEVRSGTSYPSPRITTDPRSC